MLRGNDEKLEPKRRANETPLVCPDDALASLAPPRKFQRICDLNWMRRKRWPKVKTARENPIAIADLFCGCGGLTLGLMEAARNAAKQVEVKFAIDVWKPALDVYRANFKVGESIAALGDICTVVPGDPGAPLHSTEKRLRRRLGRVHVVVAGPPCQGHSDLNNSTRRRDKRNGLYLKVIRFSEIVKPDLIIIENVPAVVHDSHNVVRHAREHLVRSGYQVDAAILSLGQFGIPQSRRRHFLIASRNGGILSSAFPQTANYPSIAISEVLSDIIDECENYDDIYRTPSRMSRENFRRVNYLFQHDLYDLPNRLRPRCHQGNNHSYRSMYGRLHWEKPSQTITSGFGSMGQGRFLHPKRPRTLTPHEAARLQGFPDFFSFSPVVRRSDLQEIIGNAVPPQISAALLDAAIRRELI